MSDQALKSPATGRPDEARAFLDAHPDIEAVQLVITDANGIGRGKNIAREELEALYASGRNVAGSILGLDVTARTSRRRGSSGRWAMPTSAAGPCRDRWRARPGSRGPRRRCSAPCSSSTGGPPAPTRATCWRAQSSGCADAGLTPVVAVELEFYLLERDEDGQLRPASGLRHRRVAGATSTPTGSGGSTTCRRSSTTCTPRPVRRACRCAR